ncbi:MAG TPA: glycosyltransferase, partial [Bacteroidota bacterium]|nr:glycosyltransferase [Bacteroidota bacterium]
RSVPPSDVVISTHFMNSAELASCKAPVKMYFAQGDQFVFDDSAPRGAEARNLHAMMKEMSRISYLLPGVRLVVNSRALGSRIEELHGRRADGYLPVCVDLNVFTPLKKSPPGGVLRILIVGPDETGSEIEPLAFKGMADARRALEILKEGGDDFTAVRISNTPPSVFNGFACEFHVAPSEDGKRTLFGTADILIYASHYDSCPRPPLEAMAAGVAVVCTSTAGAREYCRDGENALLVPPRSPENIALAVRRLMHDAALRAAIARAGRATAEEFPQEREWDELERLLLGFAGKEIPAHLVAASKAPGSSEALIAHMQNAERLMKDKDVEGALASALLAEKSASESQAVRPMICGVENFIGYCHLSLGDLESARQAFGKALEADNSSSRACTGLGDVFRLAGLADQAKTMYEWALKNDPSCEAGIRGLSTANRTLGLDASHSSLESGPDVVEDITAVKTDSAFAREVRSLFARLRPMKILETGTFIGNGTTTVIASALRDLGIAGAKFYSVEVNPGLHGMARRNLEKAGLTPFVSLLNGLSVPRALLPGREDIEKRTVTEIGTDPVYVDHAPEDRVEKYYRETDFPGVADDLIGRVLGVFEFRPDFVLLDSGGHMGNIEFNYLLSRLKGECHIALDDIFHIKHHRSFRQIQSDPRFEIVAAVREKAGFCIAHFTPAPALGAEASGVGCEASDVAGRLSHAGELFRRREFTDALETLAAVDRMVSTMPESAPLAEAVAGIETVRGMSYLGLSDLDKAKEAFEKALKIQPRSSEACAGLGEVFYLAGLDREAKVMF